MNVYHFVSEFKGWTRHHVVIAEDMEQATILITEKLQEEGVIDAPLPSDKKAQLICYGYPLDLDKEQVVF